MSNERDRSTDTRRDGGVVQIGTLRMPIVVDPSLPEHQVRFEHPDGRVDVFTFAGAKPVRIVVREADGVGVEPPEEQS